MSWTHSATREYAPDLSNIAQARRWLTHELAAGLHAPANLVADVELVLSELLTNAIKAGASRVSVELNADSERILLTVADDAAGRVVLRTPTADAPSGRGLPIVELISSAWGVDTRRAGKKVWATFAT
ncbi:MAG: ATP-binding protein [Jatrophihabitans sp.]|uniref:ATP-binding protein n=1 Tax=Jatrophihabitans sp. TaxID=1932789 RepID=UPI00390F08DF